jgi:hypothetical protein
LKLFFNDVHRGVSQNDSSSTDGHRWGAARLPIAGRRTSLLRNTPIEFTDDEPGEETTSSNGTSLQNINSAETSRQFAPLT